MKLFGNLFSGIRERPWHPPLPGSTKRFLPGGTSNVFRATATARGQHPKSGEPIFRDGAGSSIVSQSDAEREAQENANRHLAAAQQNNPPLRDSYAYAVDRRVEPVVESLALPQATGEVAKVTINSYGALVINARNVLFVDVDTRREEEGDTAHPEADDLAAEKLRAVVERQPELRFRVYRTRNGWRYLCVSRLFDPVDEETRTLLEILGADARYSLLCRAQRCFRARLTPKPWRMGEQFFNVHPTEAVTRKRLERYLKKAGRYASAGFTGEVGGNNAASPREPAMIMEYHDAWCAALSGRPLA